MKIHVCGFGAKNRSVENPESTGKDFFAEKICGRLGLSFIGSSEFAAKKFIFESMKDKYSCWEECLNDRHSPGNREIWHRLIKEYNSTDQGRLTKDIFAEYDVYVGIRDREEFLAAKDICDLSIWIDATKRIEPEDTSSCTMTSDLCDIVVENNGTIEEFDNKIARLARVLQGQFMLDKVRDGLTEVKL